MSRMSPSHAGWHHHVNATNPDRILRQWLTMDTSLTARMRASCKQFWVQRLHQRQSICLADEYALIGLQRRARVQEREVLLCCDGIPLVFAHTVVPLSANRYDWPTFRTMGEKSLGSSLFGDPAVSRGTLQFSRLSPSHPLMRRIYTAIPSEQIESRLHARRCLFRRGSGLMLVTEVFLPGITTLGK